MCPLAGRRESVRRATELFPRRFPPAAVASPADLHDTPRRVNAGLVGSRTPAKVQVRNRDSFSVSPSVAPPALGQYPAVGGAVCVASLREILIFLFWEAAIHPEAP